MHWSVAANAQVARLPSIWGVRRKRIGAGRRVIQHSTAPSAERATMKSSDLKELESLFEAARGKGPVGLARALRAYIASDRDTMSQADVEKMVVVVSKYFPLRDEDLWCEDLAGASNYRDLPTYTCATMLFGLDTDVRNSFMRYVDHADLATEVTDLVDAPLIRLRNEIARAWAPSILLKTAVVAVERKTLDRICLSWANVSAAELVVFALRGWNRTSVVRAARSLAHGRLGKVAIGSSVIMHALISYDNEECADIVARVILADTASDVRLDRWIPSARQMLQRHPSCVCRAVTRRLAKMFTSAFNEELANRVCAVISLVGNDHLHCVRTAIKDMRKRTMGICSNATAHFYIGALAILRANRTAAFSAAGKGAPICE